jgi:hypothetical protein
MSEQGGIYSAAARWDDPVAMTALLAPIPSAIAANIRDGRTQSASGFRGMRHDDETARAFFIVSDATHVQVWTFKPADATEAAQMWALLDEGPNRQIDRTVAMRVYREATGREVAYVH